MSLLHVSKFFGYKTSQGSNTLRGIVSGFSSSVTASCVQNIGSGKIATLIGGTKAGVVGAAVVGGDFYQGALFGLISTSLNHLAHEIQNKIETLRQRIARNAI